MTIKTLADLMEHLGIADRRPTEICVHDAATINEWLRMAWNHSAAVTERKVRDEIHQQNLDALAASVPEKVVKSEVPVAERKSWNRTTKRGGS